MATAPIPDVLHQLTTPRLGKVNVFVQGSLGSGEVVIFTVHDLGCNHISYIEFVSGPRMSPLSQRCVYVHVEIPGQGDGDDELPSNYTFPSMQEIADDLIHILDNLKIKQVVLFGEGAGANILARFAIAHDERVLGAVLIHCTGSTAGFLESMKDKVIGWKLKSLGMNPTAESYLVLHRFGTFKDASTEQELLNVVKSFRESLRTSINPKNLNKFINAFIMRSNLGDRISMLRCPVLFMTGGLASHRKSVHNLHETMIKSLKGDNQRRNKIELVQIDNVANVLHEKPDKVAESLQYFLQGLGLVGHLRMHAEPLKLNRRMSMEDYDRPKGRGSLTSSSPTNPMPLTEVTEPTM